MKKQNLKTFDNGMFTLNEETNTITCKQKHKGKYVYGVAKCSKDDNFDLELGKAIAYAKCELIMRKRDLESLDYFIYQVSMATNFDTDTDGCKRIAERTINSLYADRKIYERYYTNQKKIVNRLKRQPCRYLNTNYRAILYDVLQIILVEQERRKVVYFDDSEL